MCPRDQLILNHLAFATGSARNIYARLPRHHVEFEEIEAEAFAAVCRAVDEFGPDQGCTLSTFVWRNIYWAIMDYLRSIDPLSKHDRALVEAGLHEDIRLLRIETAAGVDVPPNQECSVVEREREAHIPAAIAALRPRHAALIRRHYYGGETITEAGKALGVGWSRASDIHRRSLQLMRETLQAAGIRSVRDL